MKTTTRRPKVQVAIEGAGNPRACVEGDELVIRLPIFPFSSRKSSAGRVIVASSHGIRRVAGGVNGTKVVFTARAYQEELVPGPRYEPLV